jgi:uncharacterized damage-inducible protein DinB
MRGVVDRLFAYAEGKPLTAAQKAELEAEGSAPPSGVSADQLVRAFRDQVEQALAQLRVTEERTLTEHRAVGRKQLPSTVQGLLFHAAEHVQVHSGQLLVTVRVQQSESPSPNGWLKLSRMLGYHAAPRKVFVVQKCGAPLGVQLNLEA